MVGAVSALLDPVDDDDDDDCIGAICLVSS